MLTTLFLHLGARQLSFPLEHGRGGLIQIDPLIERLPAATSHKTSEHGVSDTVSDRQEKN